MTHTQEQIAAWKKYERVRRGGKYNMFDGRAKRATGLSDEDYFYCLKNYDSLRESAITGEGIRAK